ncbi:MAG: DNA-processing protein DprA [Pseudomonadota bacterium]
MAPLRPWLQLAHARGIGPAVAQKLLSCFASAEDIINASDARLTAAGLSPKLTTALRNIDQERVNNDLKWLDGGDDRTILPLDSAAYPRLLKEISDPPVVLYVRGDPEVLQTPQLAVVGSRKPTPSAERLTYDLCTDLTGYGLTITSGLALGIDATAHRAALAAQGFTIAVTATGLDRVYPARHQQLARQIAASGAIVSEFPIGTNPLPGHFPRRNRIISGLAYGILVAEATLKSGTLTTAAHATDQSREIFAIPGAINNPMSRGSNSLIRAGATLVESAADVLTQLAPLLPGQAEFQQVPRQSADYDDDIPTGDTPLARVLRAINHEALSVDQIVDSTGLDIISVTNLTLELELQGVIETDTAGRYIKIARLQ